MAGRPLHLLIIEDSEDDAQLLVRELRKGGCEADFERVENHQEVEAALDAGPWDAVLSDFSLPSFSGFDALRLVRAKSLDLPFILVTGAIGEELAVEAMKAGAHDCILKGNYARLVPALERELRESEVRRRQRLAEEELARHREHLEELIRERTAQLAEARRGAKKLNLLIIEDSEDDALLLVRQLGKEGVAPTFTRIETAQELEFALDAGPWDAVVSDYKLPGFNGLDALRTVQAKGLDIPFILVSGAIGEELAAEVMKAGAHDFVSKGNLARLAPSLERELRDAAVRHERRQTAEELSQYREHLEELVQQRTEDLAAANEEQQAQSEELQEYSEELQRLNAELEAANAKLEAANVELEAFNYTVSHDLRGPLTHINGYSQVLSQLCADRLDEVSKGYLEEIANGTLKMAAIIETLLRFSRLTHAELRRQAVDLGELAGEIIGGLRMMEPQRAVTVTISPGLTADGDRELLRLMLENLLGNAWKYTGKREEAYIEFGVTEHDGKPVFFVRDNGEGFDMAHVEKLFSPFQRLPGVEEFKGHGIGLATVQRIIQRHGGRVWAEGKPGEGATFYFTQP